MIYVDSIKTYLREAIEPRARCNGRQWCHLFTDTEEELHDFAKKIGMKRGWFQRHKRFPHYDLVPRRRAMAVKLGAEEISLRDFMKKFILVRR